MKGRRSGSVLFATLVVAAIVVPGRADAYLDPGSGSIFFQALLATLLASLYAVKVYWRRIREALTRRRSGARPAEKSEPPAP